MNFTDTEFATAVAASGVAHEAARALTNTANLLNQRNKELAEWQAYAAQLEARVEELENEAAKKTMAAAGFKAQVTALREFVSRVAPSNHLTAFSDKVFRQGKFAGLAKSNLTLIFEAAHDAEGMQMGITNPVDFRID